jgi:hypothetical protein
MKSPNDWLEAVHREFARESDRAAGIVVAAMIDEALKDLLSKYLIPATKRDRDLVIGQRAPLGTFSARIDAAHQLGLISPFLARDLHIIREIRNTFAHEAAESTFQTPSVRDRIAALQQVSDYNRRRPDLRVTMGPPGPRGDFLGMAAWMLYSIAGKTDDIQAIKPPSPEFGYIDWDSLPEDLRKRIDEAAIQRLADGERAT